MQPKHAAARTVTHRGEATTGFIPGVLKALGAGNGTASGARRAQRPPTGGPGWKGQPLTGGIQLQTLSGLKYFRNENSSVKIAKN
jgi:hypothetical protein